MRSTRAAGRRLRFCRLSRSFAAGVGDNEVEHLPQRHAHGLRLLGHDASRTHAGNGVDLYHIGFAFGRDDEINAHHARTAARLVGDACHAVQLLRDFGCDLRRGYLVRIPFGVFGLIVEEVLLGDDLRDREQILPAPRHHHAAENRKHPRKISCKLAGTQL